MVLGGHLSFLGFCIKECDVNKWAKLCLEESRGLQVHVCIWEEPTRGVASL